MSRGEGGREDPHHRRAQRQREILVIAEGIHRQHDEERHQGEFHALHGRGNHLAGESTDNATAYPQGLTKNLDGEDSGPGRTVIGGEGGDDGLGFVGKRVGGISPAQARVNAVARKSETIENMAEVHHETGN